MEMAFRVLMSLDAWYRKAGTHSASQSKKRRNQEQNMWMKSVLMSKDYESKSIS